MSSWPWWLIGLVAFEAGALFGFMMMALFVAAGRADRDMGISD